MVTRVFGQNMIGSKRDSHVLGVATLSLLQKPYLPDHVLLVMTSLSTDVNNQITF